MTRFIFVCVVMSLASCGSKEKGAPADPADVSKAEPASADPAQASEGGCPDWAAVACGDGMVDGCSIKDATGATLTFDHACVIAGATAGPPCSQELALDCEAQGAKLPVPTQLIDACLLTPPKASTHVCVIKPGATIGHGSGTGTP